MTEEEWIERARVYLSQCRSLRRAVDRSAEEAAELRAELAAVGGRRESERVRESPQYRRLELAMARLEEAENALVARACAEAELRAALLRHLARVEDATLRAVLTARYVSGLRWEQVAEELHFSIAHIYRLHRKGLLAFAHQNENLLRAIGGESMRGANVVK